MKVLLEIKEESRVPFFMELINSLNYVDVLEETADVSKSHLAADLAEAFRDVRLHESGEKKLKSAKELLNEL